MINSILAFSALCFNLPMHMQAKVLNVWLAFKSDDETGASNSLYLGSIS